MNVADEGGYKVADQRKAARVLYLFEQLSHGKTVKKAELAKRFQTSEKTIQRDIEDLKEYCSEMLAESCTTYCGAIAYSREAKGYQMAKGDHKWLTHQDILGISRILLESRSLESKEMQGLLKKLSNQSLPEERKEIQEIIRNEQFHYQPVRHGRKLLNLLWNMGQAVRKKKLLKLSYHKESNGETVERIVEPQSVLFAECYFYLIAYIKDGGHDFPAIYRLDRIEAYEILEEGFRCESEKNRFEEGEFRKRIQFMTPGELVRLRLKCYGKSLDAVLDRLPTAKVMEADEDFTVIEAEVFGGGLVWWILSQGVRVEVLKPEKLRQEVKEKLSEALAYYH